MTKYKISDIHIHPRDGESLDKLKANYEGFYENYVLAGSTPPNALYTVLSGKLNHEKCYGFGTICYPPSGPLPSSETGAAQAEDLVRCGFDGVGECIETKPGLRKQIGVSLTHPSYSGFFSTIEKHDLPVQLHTADPLSFWDAELVSETAKARGWDYTDGTFASVGQLHEEALELVRRYPGIRFVLAHFFYITHDIDYAARMMERCPNISLDLTPGMELYRHLSERRDEWREFFIKYQDRILYGTDLQGQEPHHHYSWIGRFLETANEYNTSEITNDPKKHFHMRCLYLPENVLRKIYSSNFERLLPVKPKEVDVEYALSVAGKIKALVVAEDKCAAVDREAAYLSSLWRK
jgi:predicted TIM-barrel fold metal-dependent hydrolase